MPLIGIPSSITPELLYAMARMGHGDELVIADANFPSDSISRSCAIKEPIRVSGSTVSILADIMALLPLDQYSPHPALMMDRVAADKEKDLHVPSYQEVNALVEKEFTEPIGLLERYAFYERAKNAFAIIQTDDTSLYANIIVTKGVIAHK